MKIVFQQTNDRYIQALASAAGSIWKDSVIMWNRKAKPTLDMIKEFDPDIVFVRHIDQPLANELAFGKQKHQYKLVGIGQQTHQLFDYVCDPEPCINVAQINRGEFKKELESPLSIVIGPDYGMNPIKPVILNMLENSWIAHKIYGMNGVQCSLTNYMGAVNPKQRADIIASSDTFIDWSQQYGFMDSLWFCTKTLVFGNQDYGETVNGFFRRYNSVEEFRGNLGEDFDVKRLSIEDSITSYDKLRNVMEGLNLEDLILEKIMNKNTVFTQFVWEEIHARNN